MDALVLLDCKKNVFSFVCTEFFVRFRPGIQGINGQSGLNGIPGAKVKPIDEYEHLDIAWIYLGSTR